jgi:hypothetical protein
LPVLSLPLWQPSLRQPRLKMELKKNVLALR